jgi:ubiquinone/menaquinone biosynthesis C-methylase UbiE
MKSISDDQADIYFTQAEAYDALVSAEDADGRLAEALRSKLPAGVIADVGAGTGRVTRLLAGHATHAILLERAAPMLEVAKERLEPLGLSFETHVADARALPLEAESTDAAVAGWVFGHFRHWMPDGWREEVDQALAEMERVVRAGPLGRPQLVIETLGTGHETPRTHEALDEYFGHLESLGFERTWVRTDYVFEDVETAATTLGGFFGGPMAEKIRAQAWARVPECTGLWWRA